MDGPLPHRIVPGGSAIYVSLVLVALAGAGFWWVRRFRSDPRLLQVFAGAVVGAFAGASVAFWLAEGWLAWGDDDFWQKLANGKTVLGALLGGYGGVEGVKALVGYEAPTGDSFAAVVPLGVALGRLGCLAHGCCPGMVCASEHWFTVPGPSGGARWPAPVAEIVFNLLAFAIFLILRRRGVLPGQHFHLYLIGYGLFRFAHEFARDTPRVAGAFTGYQFLSLAVVLLGVWGFRRRTRHTPARSRR